MEGPIVNPAVPYCGPIPGGMQQGKMLRIQGAAAPDGDRFNVNLQTGPNCEPRDDTALHLSVRLNQGYIARNSCINEDWGDEDGSGSLPIGHGQKFEILILCDEKDFKIAVNGQHFCEFPQRLPKEKLSHLAIDGDVVITLISWETIVSSGVHDGDKLSQAPALHNSIPSAPPAGGFGPPGGYGPPPNMPPGGGYGPPPNFPGGFAGAPGFGRPPPQGPHGAPPPPGAREEGGLDGFLHQAQSMLVGAIATGAAEKILGGLLKPNQGGFAPENAKYGHYPQPNQGGLFGSGGMGGLGGSGGGGNDVLGSLLGSLTGQNQHGSSHQTNLFGAPIQQSGQGGGLGSILGSLAENVFRPDGGNRNRPF